MQNKLNYASSQGVRNNGRRATVRSEILAFGTSGLDWAIRLLTTQFATIRKRIRIIVDVSGYIAFSGINE